MKILISSKLSEHRYKTPEGYLVCVDSILSRTGKQSYTRDEVFHDKDTSVIDIDRRPEEVFSDKTLASFENKPLTIEHPDEDVTAENHDKYAVGFTRDIKRGKDGDQDVMLGTLVITNADAVSLIESGGLTELSCGYDCDITDEANPQQRNIRGNHIALCEQGRAGIARIIDSTKDSADNTLREKIANKKSWDSIHDRYVVADIKIGFKYVAHGKTYEVIDKLPMNRLNVKCSDGHIYRLSSIALMEDLNGSIAKEIHDSVHDSWLPRAERNKISNYLSMISTFTHRDLNISDIIRPLQGKGYKVTLDNVDGWNKMSDGMMRKDYYFSVDGYDDKFMISLYAKEGEWKVNEINAYFNDSVKDFKEYRVNLPIKWSANGHTFEVTRPGPGRFGLKIDGVGEMSASSLFDIDDHLKAYKTEIPNDLHDSTKNNVKKDDFTSVSASKSNIITKAQAINKIKNILSDKSNITSDSEGMLYLTTKAYTEIQTLAKTVGLTRADMENISKFWFNKGAYGSIVDSIKDRLVEVPQNIIMSFEHQLKQNHIGIAATGRTWSGLLHYQVEFTGSAKNLAIILDKISASMHAMNVPMTYTAGDDGEGFATAGIDINKQFVKDSVKDAKHNFNIHWIDTYTKSKGGDKSEWSYRTTIVASSPKEALEKLKAIALLDNGVGSAYLFIISFSEETSTGIRSWQRSSKIDEFMKFVEDSALTKDKAIKIVKAVKKHK